MFMIDLPLVHLLGPRSSHSHSSHSCGPRCPFPAQTFPLTLFCLCWSVLRDSACMASYHLQCNTSGNQLLPFSNLFISASAILSPIRAQGPQSPVWPWPCGVRDPSLCSHDTPAFLVIAVPVLMCGNCLFASSPCWVVSCFRAGMVPVRLFPS